MLTNLHYVPSINSEETWSKGNAWPDEVYTFGSLFICGLFLWDKILDYELLPIYNV